MLQIMNLRTNEMIREIVNADVMQYIKLIDDSSVDLIILDPDYNDWSRFMKENLIEESMRILKSTGNLILFTKQPFDLDLRNYICPWFRREIIWSFENGGAWVSNKMPLVSFQKIYWCTKSKDFYFNPRTGQNYSENTRNFNRSQKTFGGWREQGKYFEKSKDGVWLRDHLHFNKPLSREIPAKPYDLIKIMVTCFSPPCGTVFDAFSGTGTVAKVADELGRLVIATEINEERCMNIIDHFMSEDADE